MRRTIAFLPALLLATGAAAAEPPSAGDRDTLRQAEEAAREGLRMMLNSVELLLRSVPRYELPEFNENGDIIIRRKPAPPEPPQPRRDKTI